MPEKVERVAKHIVPEGGTPSIYSNNVEILITNWDFRFKFNEILDTAKGIATVAERVQIVMSPQHTKALLETLQKNMANFEKAMGEVRVKPINAAE